jgi:quinohemoprotein ethanol dehydrogenase
MLRPRTVVGVLSIVVVSFVRLSLMAEPQVRHVDDNALKNAGSKGEEWLTYGLAPGETRYSPLNQIDSRTVTRLGLAWDYNLQSEGGGQQATPLVWNGTIYGVTNWSIAFAVDARTGKEKWRWDPEVNKATMRSRLCCVVNRGLAIYQNLVFLPVIDGRLQALDIDTGRPVWEARVAYPQDIYSLTMAPRIAKGKVIIGVSGGDKINRGGFFDAYDAATGRRVWRFYTTPGDPSKPFENPALKKAAETWDGQWWKNGGGGAVWDGLAYDPEAELVYVGTGNAQPYPYKFRGLTRKDNLYTCSILAVDVNTGDLRWYYQVVPGDVWDYDSTQHLLLADLRINGRVRKVITQASKNGFFYVIDRLTGEFISAAPFAKVTWATGIDQKTGRPIVNPEAVYDVDPVRVSPSGGGAHNWSPMAFNPNSGLVYIPASTGGSMVFAAQPTFDPKPGVGGHSGLARPGPPGPPRTLSSEIGPEAIEGPGSGAGGGALIAWDPVTQQIRWRRPGGGALGGGALTTAGNLVFQTLNDGRLLAYTADAGDKVLDKATGLRGGMGPPITYQLDSKQYIALMGGAGVDPASGNPPPPVGPKLLVYALDGAATLSSAASK